MGHFKEVIGADTATHTWPGAFCFRHCCTLVHVAHFEGKCIQLRSYYAMNSGSGVLRISCVRVFSKYVRTCRHSVVAGLLVCMDRPMQYLHDESEQV